MLSVRAGQAAVLGQRKCVVDYGFILAQIYPVDEFRQERPRLGDVFRDCVDGGVGRDGLHPVRVPLGISQHFRGVIWQFSAGIRQNLGQCPGVAVGHDRFGDLAKNPAFKFSGRHGRETLITGADGALVDGVLEFVDCAKAQDVLAVVAVEETFQHVGGLVFSSSHIVLLLWAMWWARLPSTRNDNAIAALGGLHVMLCITGQNGRDTVCSGRVAGLRGEPGSDRVVVVIRSSIEGPRPRAPPYFSVSGERKIQQP